MTFGIDVGGTTIKIGVFENDKMIDRYEIPTQKDQFLIDICKSIKKYMADHNIAKIAGIGFGLPGNVKDNYIFNLPNIGVKNVDLEEVVSSFFPNVPIAALNDANAAALGELLCHLKDQNACMITLGTGVGGGIILNGKVLEGVHGAAGEIGHMPLATEYNFACTCGAKGCLETVASATGIVRLAKYHKKEFATSLGQKFSAKDVFDKAALKDPLCLYVVDRVGYYLAKCIATLAVTIDVEVFYIGGGVSQAGKLLIQAIKKYYKKLAHYAVKDVRIETASLLNDAGMLGCAFLIRSIINERNM